MNKLVLLSFLSVFNIKPVPICKLNTRVDFSQRTPTVLRNGRILEPTDRTGDIVIRLGEFLILSCKGAGYIQHPHVRKKVVTGVIACEGGDYFTNSEWLKDDARFLFFLCMDPPKHSSQRTTRTCFEGHPVYEVGYKINNSFYPTYESCFNEANLRVIYSKYTLKPYNANFLPGMSRPYFIDDGVYGNVSTLVDSLYSGEALFQLVNKYFVRPEPLSRGHLAARTDFVFPFSQRTTYHYVNCAPQWKELNGGNWNTLEVELRKRINAERYNTTIYTGTYGVNKLMHRAGYKEDVYLHTDENNNPVIPVPLYFYKVVYNPGLKKGTAYICINNPFYSPAEAKELFFCQNKCQRNITFYWLTWQYDSADDGYCFCCTIPDFRKTVKHLPPFEVNDLLT